MDHTIAEAAQQFQLSNTVIRKYTKLHDWVHKKPRTSFDLGFFERETPELGYVLGWIASDGCVEHGKVIINLKDTDYKVLLSLNRLTSNLIPIRFSSTFDERTNKTYKHSTLFWYSVKLPPILEKYNLVPQKSLIMEWPILVPEMLIPYIRGFSDG